MPAAARAEDQTRRWLAEFVVGLNLCPFARPLLDNPQLRIAVSDVQDEAALFRFFLRELDLLQSTPEADVATSLLVFTGALGDFDEYLDFLHQGRELLVEAGLEGLVQLASFHPRYQFDGEPADAVSHFSNRSPWPTIHLIREDMLSRVLGDFPDPEAIPGRNIETLESIGSAAIKARWQRLLA
ncbi:DUF1415 domain-containing protein [Pseudohalioglobus sediminis]|uniref:DUF1415 domain-containing protein n=1 Tax=Pseudohalioglobus sediminis TaxID=2606449 RepID=A0A5B0WU68_9GAMM|nr:DUF1415 domain-containing protein [Pseudohalioglobus sediminis]KAA1190463.1 DUF1415 domain-containing protein [Pseudohalioglobus sediminis]